MALIGDFDLNSILDKVTIAYLGEGRVWLTYSKSWSIEERPSKNLEAEADAVAKKECCFLAYSS